MQSPIRLNIEVTPQGTSLTGLEQLADRIAADMQGTANQVGRAFTTAFQQIGAQATAAFAGINAQLQQTINLLTQIATRTAQIGGGGTNPVTNNLVQNIFRGAGVGGGAAQPSPAAIQASIQSNLAYLNQGSFNQVGNRIIRGPNQNYDIGIYRNDEGAIARLNMSTGQLSANLETAQSRWSGLVSAFGAGRSVIVSVAAALYSFERVGSIIKNSLIDPFVDFTKQVISSTEKYREFQLAVTGVVGGGARAREITTNLIAASRLSPLTSVETLESARAAAFTPGLAGRFAFGPASQAAASFNEYAQLLAKASTLDPEQGERGVGIALRELLSGNAQSVRRRLEVNPQAIADTIGKRLSEILADPQLALQAFTKFTDIYVGEESFQGQRGLFSTAQRKFTDAGNQAFAAIGDAGVYDQLTDRLRGLTDLILDEFNPKNPRFKAQADRISDSIVGIVDNILSALAGGAAALTGNRNVLDSIGELTATIFELAQKATSYLPVALEAIGVFFNSLFDIARNAADFVANPVGYSASRAVSGASMPTSGGMGYLSMGMNPAAYFMDVANQPAAASNVGRNPFDFSGVRSQFGNLGRNYAIERVINRSIGAQYSGISGRVGAQAIVNPITQVTGGADYRSPFNQLLEREAGIASQISNILYDKNLERDFTKYGGQSGYLGMLGAARADVLVARRAPSQQFFGGGPKLPFDTLTGRLSDLGPTNYQVLSGAIGADRAKDFFSRQMKDRQDTAQAIENLPDRLVRELQDLTGSIVMKFRELPPTFGAVFGDALQENVAGLANEIAGVLKLPDAEAQKLRDAIKSGPVELTNLIQSAVFELKLRAINAGLPIDALPGSSGQILRGAGQSRPDTLRRLISLRGERSSTLSARYDALYSESGGGARSREDQIGLGQISADLIENQRQLVALQRELDVTAQAYEEFGIRARDALESNLGRGISDLIKGTGSLRDALLGFVDDIINAFSDLAAKNIVNGLIGNLGQAGQGPYGGPGAGGGLFGAALGGIFSGVFGFATGGATGKLPGGTPVKGGTHYQFGDGGVMPGSFVPFVPFASGGVATGPTLGLIAERGMPEAVVPLPDGRSIPVRMQSDSGAGGSIFIVASYDEAIAAGFQKNKDTIVDLIAGEASRGGSKLNRAIRGN